MTPTEALEAYCDAFVKGDIARIGALFAEDGRCELPLLERPLEGREEILHEVGTAVRGLRDMRVEFGPMIESGNEVFAEGIFRSEMVGAGTHVDLTPVRADFRFAMIVEMRDGRIARLAEYLDTKRVKPWERQRLYPIARTSPYFQGTVEAGVSEFMTYNGMFFPIIYSRTPAEEYVALTERVTMWDVGCERQTEIRGPDALNFADYLATRNLLTMKTGGCRYTYCCDDSGAIICDPVVLRPWDDVVWFSHGSADLTLWAQGIALHSDFDVEVSEPDVAPIQVQGPLSADVLRGVVEAPIDDLRFYRCVATRVAGIEAVVSRTGWSGALGYEVFPLSSARAMELWNALREAGKPYDMLVTGPIVHRAVERNVTDTAYHMSSGMNPYEAGGERLVDLDSGPFMGRAALERVRAEGPRRRTVGLLIEGDLPRLEWYWPIADKRGGRGEVRWAVHSFALDRSIGIALVDAAVEIGETVRVTHPLGTVAAEVCELPFVE
jgi:glycine cleavage system aminomethyltransferase T/ketosteroid isomerase-like protein